MGAQNGGQLPGLWRRDARAKTQAGNVTGGRDSRLDAKYGKSTGPLSDTAGRLANISVVVLVSYTGRLKRPHLHCRADAVAETSARAVPYHSDTPLSFVLARLCVWYTGHGRGEANKRPMDSKRGATGDNYPAHNRPYCRAVASLNFWKLGKSRNSFPRIKKKDRDSRLWRLVNILSLRLWPETKI